ncbi:Selenocysteine-specific elongation factor, partial [Pseudolycoriella hygida]
MILNLNIGILGHVDSGKTSLAKCLSDTASTACFDKNPQSQERGITLDLGFSSYQCDLPTHLLEHSTKYSKLQFTFIDCPGHAKLIKTVIGGSQIMDLFVLVVDVTKGIQTQTAECLVIGGLSCDRLIVALNKIDLLDAENREKVIEKMTKKLSKTLVDTPFKDAPIVPISAANDVNITGFLNVCKQCSYIPMRDAQLPFLFAVDHCFSIRGQGTICTGTVLQGHVKVGDEVEIPSKEVKKVKSIQMFRQPMNDARQGDRIGISITQFDAKLLERGLIAAPKYVKLSTVAVIKLNKIKYFKGKIVSKSKFHFSVGHSTVMASILLFKGGASSQEFNCQQEYEYVSEVDDTCDENVFVLLEFQKATVVVPNLLVVASKLDMDLHSNNCRIAFW